MFIMSISYSHSEYKASKKVEYFLKKFRILSKGYENEREKGVKR